ncbi:hypothetical protein BC939DRAFT_38728 [Gamsiella multidivaricata]|uniref:uncharacterized protein n=1 Tax=Gamsiella multidivaricata TaxID=101098 RepID=UPI00221EEC60|nr:uncharacterized protein BC939DRAFT_38728 [Gamsiella multidivaricata]KAG0365375.1 hypothetical protein BGZ54_006582 [Gamsiella multidivaricata]KAI7828934.1 hypothetical protein BC939DRAFT_38728 [Gamsiella multidivaricata]
MATLTTLGSATVGDVPETEQTFQPSDFSFLSQLLHILQKVETGEDPQEIATLASNLKTSFKKCQTILDHLPGADLSPDEQSRILAEEMQVLEKKRTQLASYLSWQVFQHDALEAAIKQEHSNNSREPKLSTPEPIADAAPASASLEVDNTYAEQEDDPMGDSNEVEVKAEQLESTPSLTQDTSFLSNSSQNTVPSSSQPTGLTFPLSDIKMEDPQNTPM